VLEPFALGFAVLGAIGYGSASVLQAVGVARGAGGLSTFANPAYLLGLGLDLLAWLVSLVALRTLPVYQVQSILAGSIAVTVLLAWWFLGHRLSRFETVAIGVTIGALAVLGASSGPQPVARLGSAAGLGLALAALGVAALGLAAVAAGRPTLTGAIAGLAFGGAALCARAVSVPEPLFSHSGLTDLATDPLAYGLLGYGITGMLLYAQALEDGAVGPVTAMLWIAEVVAPSIVGVLLLGDSARAGWLPATVLALIAAVLAAGALAFADPSDPSDPSESAGPAESAGSADPAIGGASTSPGR
jgi:drug/metabolite transporter (DMT)-like permease